MCQNQCTGLLDSEFYAAAKGIPLQWESHLSPTADEKKPAWPLHTDVAVNWNWIADDVRARSTGWDRSWRRWTGWGRSWRRLTGWGRSWRRLTRCGRSWRRWTGWGRSWRRLTGCDFCGNLLHVCTQRVQWTWLGRIYCLTLVKTVRFFCQGNKRLNILQHYLSFFLFPRSRWCKLKGNQQDSHCHQELHDDWCLKH